MKTRHLKTRRPIVQQKGAAPIEYPIQSSDNPFQSTVTASPFTQQAAAAAAASSSSSSTNVVPMEDITMNEPQQQLTTGMERMKSLLSELVINPPKACVLVEYNDAGEVKLTIPPFIRLHESLERPQFDDYYRLACRRRVQWVGFPIQNNGETDQMDSIQKERNRIEDAERLLKYINRLPTDESTTTERIKKCLKSLAFIHHVGPVTDAPNSGYVVFHFKSEQSAHDFKVLMNKCTHKCDTLGSVVLGGYLLPPNTHDLSKLKPLELSLRMKPILPTNRLALPPFDKDVLARIKRKREDDHAKAALERITAKNRKRVKTTTTTKLNRITDNSKLGQALHRKYRKEDFQLMPDIHLGLYLKRVWLHARQSRMLNNSSQLRDEGFGIFALPTQEFLDRTSVLDNESSSLDDEYRADLWKSEMKADDLEKVDFDELSAADKIAFADESEKIYCANFYCPDTYVDWPDQKEDPYCWATLKFFREERDKARTLIATLQAEAANNNNNA